MSKKQALWEKKTDDKRKTVSQSFRTTSEVDKIITEKAKQADMTKSGYIVNACLQTVIRVIPEGKEILATVQEAKNLIREFPSTALSKEADTMFSQVICRLHSIIA